MAPNLRKLSLSLVSLGFFLSGGLVAGYPQSALHAIEARGENNVATATSIPILTATISPCLIIGCSSADLTSFQEDICENARSSLSDEDAEKYSVICEVDFPGQDIAPFLNVTCFDECKSACDEHNESNNGTKCAGFVYAPGRINGADDCYLKSSLNYPTAASVHLVGATIIPTPSFTSTSSPSSSSTSSLATAIPKAASGAQAQDDGPAIAEPAPSSTEAATLVVATVKELGTSVNKPTNKYVSHLPALPMKLAAAMLKPGINTDLITGYSLASDTGIYSSNMALLKPNLATMKTTPKLARDGGKGGMIDGTHLVYFCDTAVTSDDQLVSLVSSSVATDNSMNGLYGNALELVDNLGEWQDDVGRMRGFAPMTQGEEAFNIAMSGSGYRYAIWPESSPIPINGTHSLIYASILYDQVNMTTQQYDLSPLGNTILVVANDPIYGPTAGRPITQLFQQGEITYGSLGGFRAWGKQGLGNQDGEIYLFGQVPNGVFLAKTIPSAYTLRASYSYWDGHTWGTTVPDRSNLDALILNESVKDFDLIYAPGYQTLIMMYLTNMPDNTFYYRFCKPRNIVAPYEPSGNSDWAEAIHSCDWTDRGILYVAPTPQREFIYAGGVHAGYYGNDDITFGGDKMLISWTEKTGADASSPDANYAHKTAYVNWGTNSVVTCPENATGC